MFISLLYLPFVSFCSYLMFNLFIYLLLYNLLSIIYSYKLNKNNIRMGSVASVLICQQSPKEEKGKWMWRHKSLGLLTGMIVAPRIGYRLMNAAKYKVGHPTGKSAFVLFCHANSNVQYDVSTIWLLYLTLVCLC